MSQDRVWKNERKAYLRRLMGGECVQCGETERLHFDHINPSTKSFNITEFSTCSLETLTKELEKCQLLCIRCHANKTWRERGYTGKSGYYHGKLSTYVNKHCRCVECRQAALEYEQRRYSARNAKRRALKLSYQFGH